MRIETFEQFISFGAGRQFMVSKSPPLQSHETLQIKLNLKKRSICTISGYIQVSDSYWTTVQKTTNLPKTNGLKHEMTLHEAIEKLLRQTDRPITTQEIADELNKNNWYQKKDGSKITAYQIHGRTKNYANLFNRNGTKISISGQTAVKAIKVSTKPTSRKSIISDKDEQYILDLCDKVLGLSSSRQHKFDFLLGDPNSKGIATKLPVDSFYEELNLVVEYRERQHTESVNFFDKPNRMTVSGVYRGEQRKIYDERRREILPKHQINLVEISFTDFNHDRQKRIIKNPKLDEAIIKQKLNGFVR